jgi:hypothetical protein
VSNNQKEIKGKTQDEILSLRYNKKKYTHIIEKLSKVAPKDVVAYKILRPTLSPHSLEGAQSVIQGFNYKFNKRYKTTFGYTIGSSDCFIDRGFHSYKKMCESVKRADKDYVYKIIIPKGSRYYEGTKGDLVSNQIIIKNVRPFKNE